MPVKKSSLDWTKSYSFGQVNSWKGGIPKGVMAPPSGVNNPKCLPKSLGFTEKFAQTKILARFMAVADGVGATGAIPTILAQVYNPSNRLRCIVTIAYEADTSNVDPAFATTVPNWSVTPMSKNPVSGRETPLQVVYPEPGTGNQNTPDSYEVDTNIKLLRISLEGLTDASLSASYVPTTGRCNVMLIAEWEPSVEMSKEERDALYAQCVITCGPPVLIVNNAV
jgi:hypothetical protein